MQNRLKEKMDCLIREREELLVQLEVLSEDWSAKQDKHLDLAQDVHTLREENQRLLEKVRSASKVLQQLPEGQVPKKKAASSLRRQMRRKSG